MLKEHILSHYNPKSHIPVTVWSKAQVCSRLFAGIADSIPAEGMVVRLQCILCKQRPLRRADLSFRKVLTAACACVSVCDIETATKKRPRPKAGCSATEEKIQNNSPYSRRMTK
jgi:hypothetical protein